MKREILNSRLKPVNSRQWADFLTMKSVKMLSPKSFFNNSTITLLCAEDSSAVREESQNITAMHRAVKIQKITAYIFLFFPFGIYKAHPSAAGMKLYAADSLCHGII